MFGQAERAHAISVFAREAADLTFIIDRSMFGAAREKQGVVAVDLIRHGEGRAAYPFKPRRHADDVVETGGLLVI